MQPPEPGPGGLFAGTAPYYARYRAECPPEVLDALRTAFALDSTGRLLDLGCGTGHVCLPLHRDVAEIVALDISEEMIVEGRRQAAARGITNITWLLLPAEAITSELGHVRLVTVGNAFHWMDRPLVLARCRELLAPGGGIALVGTPSLATIWRQGRPRWEQAVVAVVRRWLGEERRADQGSYRIEEQDRHEHIVARAGFGRIELGLTETRRTLDVDSVLGELYSTSFCSPALLGANTAAFESDLRVALLAAEPSGFFVHEGLADWIFAWP